MKFSNNPLETADLVTFAREIIPWRGGERGVCISANLPEKRHQNGSEFPREIRELLAKLSYKHFGTLNYKTLSICGLRVF